MFQLINSTKIQFKYNYTHYSHLFIATDIQKVLSSRTIRYGQFPIRNIYSIKETTKSLLFLELSTEENVLESVGISGVRARRLLIYIHDGKSCLAPPMVIIFS